MEIRVKTLVGKSEFEFLITDNKEMDALHKAIVLGNPPQYCNECQNNQYFRMDSNKDKEGNTYVNVICSKCGAKAKLGQYKVGGYFWHKFEKWQGKNQNEEVDTEKELGSEEIPF
jgi:hypothetical protein